MSQAVHLAALYPSAFGNTVYSFNCGVRRPERSTTRVGEVTCARCRRMRCWEAVVARNKSLAAQGHTLERSRPMGG